MIADIRKRLEKATPWPWGTEAAPHDNEVCCGEWELALETDNSYDADFIAHARRTIFKLVTFLVIVDMIADFLIKLFYKDKDYRIHREYYERQEKEKKEVEG